MNTIEAEIAECDAMLKHLHAKHPLEVLIKLSKKRRAAVNIEIDNWCHRRDELRHVLKGSQIIKQ